jgi:hypothetical protein
MCGETERPESLLGLMEIVKPEGIEARGRAAQEAKRPHGCCGGVMLVVPRLSSPFPSWWTNVNETERSAK